MQAPSSLNLQWDKAGARVPLGSHVLTLAHISVIPNALNIFRGCPRGMDVNTDS